MNVPGVVAIIQEILTDVPDNSGMKIGLALMNMAGKPLINSLFLQGEVMG